MRHTPLRRRAPLRRSGPPRRSAPPRRTGPAAGSAAQRAKVAGRPCLACARPTRIDPAHLIPRSLGGCEHPDCVVPLCRACHRAYDQGRLDLVAHLEPRFRREVAHAVAHVGIVRALWRLSGRRPEAGSQALRG